MKIWIEIKIIDHHLAVALKSSSKRKSKRHESIACLIWTFYGKEKVSTKQEIKSHQKQLHQIQMKVKWRNCV